MNNQEKKYELIKFEDGELGEKSNVRKTHFPFSDKDVLNVKKI